MILKRLTPVPSPVATIASVATAVASIASVSPGLGLGLSFSGPFPESSVVVAISRGIAIDGGVAIAVGGITVGRNSVAIRAVVMGGRVGLSNGVSLGFGIGLGLSISTATIPSSSVASIAPSVASIASSVASIAPRFSQGTSHKHSENDLVNNRMVGKILGNNETKFMSTYKGLHGVDLSG